MYTYAEMADMGKAVLMEVVEVVVMEDVVAAEEMERKVIQVGVLVVEEEDMAVMVDLEVGVKWVEAVVVMAEMVEMDNMVVEVAVDMVLVQMAAIELEEAEDILQEVEMIMVAEEHMVEEEMLV